MIASYYNVSNCSIIRHRQQRPTKITKAYLMAAAYCASFGGTGTIVGTGTNLTFKGIFESTFPQAEGINFMQWMVASMPQMIINSFLTWLYLRIIFLGYLRPDSEDAQLAYIGEEGETITNQVTSNLSIFQTLLVDRLLLFLPLSSFVGDTGTIQRTRYHYVS